jgi:multiple sugar transport system ATP-binding protein
MTLADRVAIMDKGKIQQLGTPDEVYNDPANVFVAGFIGSPPMNLIQGALENGTFVAANTRVPKVGKGSRAKVTLGIRPEDVSVAKTGSGHHNSTVYSIEPTGDQTLLAVEHAGKLIVARADRNFRQAIDTPVSLNFDTTRTYLFDTETGQRIRD